jgi:hypothetical protein
MGVDRTARPSTRRSVCSECGTEVGDEVAVCSGCGGTLGRRVTDRELLRLREEELDRLAAGRRGAIRLPCAH